MGNVEKVALAEPAEPLAVARGVPLQAEEEEGPPVVLAESLAENEGSLVDDGVPLSEVPALREAGLDCDGVVDVAAVAEAAAEAEGKGEVGAEDDAPALAE